MSATRESVVGSVTLKDVLWTGVIPRGCGLSLRLVSRATREAVRRYEIGGVCLVSRYGFEGQQYADALGSLGRNRVLSLRARLPLDRADGLVHLLRGLEGCEHLETVDLRECEIGTLLTREQKEAARALVYGAIEQLRLPALKSLRLWSPSCGKWSLECLARLASATTTLRDLSVGCAHLASATTTLTDLSVGYTGLHDDEMSLDKLGQGLCHLRSLKIQRCEFEDGVLGVLEMLLRKCALECVDLSTEVVARTAAATANTAALPPNTALSELRLSFCSNGEEDEKRLARLISAAPRLKVCEVMNSDLVVGSNSSIFQALRAHKELRELRLNFLLNALCVPWVLFCLPKLTSLHTLSLNCEGLTSEEEERLLAAVGRVRTLREFSLCGKGNDQRRLLDLRGALERLQKLDLSFVHMALGFTTPLCSVLAGAHDLLELHLDSSHIGGEGSGELARALQQCPNLRVLSLGSCFIGDRGVCKFSEERPCTYRLCKLKLQHNRITARAAAALGCLIALHGETLRVLDIGENAIGREGIEALAGSEFALPRCQRLKLNGMSLGAGTTALVLLLSRCPVVRKLNLCNNDMDSVAVVHLAAALAPCRALERVQLDWNLVLNHDGQTSQHGLRALIERVKRLPRMRSLSLAVNRLDVPALELLVDGLRECNGLLTVHIGQNFYGETACKLHPRTALFNCWGISLD